MSNQVKHYQNAIEILANNEVDFKEICVNLAKQHPKIFVELSNSKQMLKMIKFKKEVQQISENEGKISAIKFVKIETDKDLREAKTYVESLAERNGFSFYLKW